MIRNISANKLFTATKFQHKTPTKIMIHKRYIKSYCEVDDLAHFIVAITNAVRSVFFYHEPVIYLY